MKAQFSTLVFAVTATMAASNASAAVACQTPFGVVPVPQFTYFAGVPCTNGYVSGLTVILPPPPPVFVSPPAHTGHFPHHPMHVPPPPRPRHNWPGRAGRIEHGNTPRHRNGHDRRW